MADLIAKVVNSRLKMDVPTTLPEGSEWRLVADDEGDSLTDEERKRLHAALDAALDDYEAGDRGVSPEEWMAELRSRR